MRRGGGKRGGVAGGRASLDEVGRGGAWQGKVGRGPFEIHLLIGTNKFYVARQRSARGTAVGAVRPSAGTPPPAAQHSQPGPLLPWLKGNLQCKGDSLKSYTQEFLKKMAIN